MAARVQGENAAVEGTPLFDDNGKPPQPGNLVTLCASRCTRCGRAEFPAKLTCPACGSESKSERLPNAGRLRGFTAVLHAPPGALVAVPYSLGVACFNDEINILGLLEGPTDELTIGLPVETIAVAPSEELLTYAFRLA
jgi:uncharacterized OB-fold protein